MKARACRTGVGSLVFLSSFVAIIPSSSFAQNADDFVGRTNSPPPAPQLIASTFVWDQPESAVSEFSISHELQRRVYFSDGSHKIEPLNRNYKEIGSGLAYRGEDGKWRRSSVEPEIQADGTVVFRHLSAVLTFSSDANTDTVLAYETPKRSRARSGLAGLVYTDPKDRFVLIASVKNSTAQAYDGGVYFTNVLKGGVDADLVYRVQPGSLEQDIVLFGGLPRPSDLGMSDADTRLCILTELVGAEIETMGVDRDDDAGPSDSSPAPLELSSRAPGGGFERIYNFQRCYAYSEDDGVVTLAGQGRGLETDEPVGMRVLKLGGRLYLSEELPVKRLSDSSPYLFTAAPGKTRELVTADRLTVPSRPSRAEAAQDARPRTDARQAAYVPRAAPRYMVDYVNYIGTVTNNLTFKQGVTYVVSSDLIISGAKLTIEPGAFVKLATNAQIKFQSGAQIETKSSALNPAIFTSVYDTNAGETISGYIGNPTTNRYATALYFECGTNQIAGLDIRFANYGLRVRPGSQNARVKDCSFSYGGAWAVEAAAGQKTTEVRNCLFRLSGGGVSCWTDAVRVASCTFEQVGLAVSNASAVKSAIVENSLLASVSNACLSFGVTTSLTHNACWNSPTGGLGADVIVLTNNPFVSGPYGAFYLQQTTNLVDRGTTNANKVGLYHYTTASNQVKESSTIVDIGFHYATPADGDGDGLPDYQEDSDGDGVYTNADDLSNWASADTDGDGLNDGTEVNIYGTNPELTNTDGDGFSDGVEVYGGSNPLATNSYLTAISGAIANPTPVSGPLYVYARSGPATNGLVLHYSFASNRYGLVTDLSGCGHTGYVAGATYITNGPGGWYAFDGADDYIRVTNAAALNPPQFTIAAWAKTYEAPAVVVRGLFGKHRAFYDSHSYLMPTELSEFQGRLYGSSYMPGRVTVNPSLLLNQWGHVALTYDGSNWRLYTNGSLSATTNVAGYQGNAFDLLIGAGELTSGTAVPSLFWKGTIDDVTLYNWALSASDLANLYGAGVNANLQRETTISGSGAYTITKVPTLKSYTIYAWLDGNTNGILDQWEPRGEYAGNPLALTGPAGGINIVLVAPDTDADGMPDWWELKYGLNPTSGLSSALSAWWKFDETSGTNADNAVSTKYDGQLVNMATSAWTSGQLGGALLFDGTNDYVRVPQSPPIVTGNQFTASAWTWLDSGFVSDYPTVIADWTACGSGYPGYWFGYEPYVGGPGSTIGSCSTYSYIYAAAVMTSRWSHVVEVYDGTNMYIYYNGSEIARQAEVFSAATQAQVNIGWDSEPTYSYHWKGKLDDVRLYTTALSSNAVYTMYDALADPDEDGVNNLTEYLQGRDPTKGADSDTMGVVNLLVYTPYD